MTLFPRLWRMTMSLSVSDRKIHTHQFCPRTLKLVSSTCNRSDSRMRILMASYSAVPACAARVIIACTLAGASLTAMLASRKLAVFRMTPRMMNRNMMVSTMRLMPKRPCFGVCPSLAANLKLHMLHWQISLSTILLSGLISFGISSICWRAVRSTSMSSLWQFGHSFAVMWCGVVNGFHCRLVPRCPRGAPRSFPDRRGKNDGLRCGCADGGVFGFLYLRSSFSRASFFFFNSSFSFSNSRYFFMISSLVKVDNFIFRPELFLLSSRPIQQAHRRDRCYHFYSPASQASQNQIFEFLSLSLLATM